MLAADVRGNPANPAVLFTHGGGQTRYAWGDAGRHFAEEGFYTVNLDLRGHGESDWDSNGEYGIDYFLDDVRRVAIKLPQSPRPAMVGASLGGIASMLAVGETETPLASALVLVDIVPKINAEGTRRIIEFMKANTNGFASVEEAADAVSEYLSHRPRPTDVSGLKKNLRKGDNGRWYWHWDPAFVFGNRYEIPETNKKRMETAARGINIPVLLVKGGISEIVDDEGVEHFRQLLPNARVVDVQNAGHMVAGDKNNAFETAVLEFLKQELLLDH